MKREKMIEFRAFELMTLFQLGCAFIVSLFCKKKPLWLISERGVDARDNGYWLFKYIKDNHPEIDVRYIISKNSPDRNKLLPYVTDLVSFQSFRHYVLIWQASHLISTHIQGYFPYVGLGLWVKQHFSFYNKKKHVFLQHGITINYSHFLDYSNTSVDLLTAAVRPEYDSFISAFGYPANVVQLTGFCRFDQLTTSHAKRQILIMPTWREWLYVKSKFAETEFVKNYISFLTDGRLTELLASKDLNLIFYLHHTFQQYIGVFQNGTYDKRITIASENDFDVQTLLKESMLLITDYSSVFFDFVYMKKPVVFYQFDIEKFRQAHYAKGWFDYNHSFGTIVMSEDELIAATAHYVKNNFTMDDSSKSYVDECFPTRDTHNTERVFGCIQQLTSK